MSSIPADDAAWRKMIRAGQPPFWKELAERSGASVLERDGWLAAIFPDAPTRSIFNSVFYEDGNALIAGLGAIAAAYEDAGVEAWTVWVPEADKDVAASLQAAGHHDDAQPRDMGMPISDLRPPDPDPELEIREEYDLATMARINEVAYGWAPGEFQPMERAEMSDLRVYFGLLGGEKVASLGIWAHGPGKSDAEIAWVACLPEARGRGISGRLLAHALSDAAEAGLETTTLQSTKLGYPVYERLGYRDYGTVHMWERRATA